MEEFDQTRRDMGAECSLEADVGGAHAQRSAALGDRDTKRPYGVGAVGDDVGEDGDGERDREQRSQGGNSRECPGAVPEKSDAQHGSSADKGNGTDQQQPSTEGHQRGKRSVGLAEIDTAERKPAERPQAPERVCEHYRCRHRTDERQ